MAVIEPKNARLRIERFDYRIVFAKQGRAIYISHLDMMRAFQRIIKRAKLPVWHTQGFNPHVYIMFPLALSLGMESRCEVMDIALIEELSYDEVKERLSASMPEGFEVISVGAPVHKHTDIAFSCYETEIAAQIPSEEVVRLFEDFLKRDTIEIEKRTKKKTTKLVDIKPYIECEGLEAGDGSVKVKLRLPSGTGFNLNLNVVIDAFASLSGIEVETICARRTNILMENGENFT
ncbi:MAG: TIGR03936 family radical SAM-associated protein [Ruminococcus sp.]|nr:TIGR03936 family radical SAM-associated protein [Ruminococcus sp.]